MKDWTPKQLIALILTVGLLFLLVFIPVRNEITDVRHDLDEMKVIAGVIAAILGTIAICMKEK